MKQTNKAVLAGFLVLVAGCYSLQPAIGPEPKLGEVVAFDITDLGRAQLGGSMGPEISQVQGKLLEAEDGGYVLGVTSVRTFRRGTQVWSGERVRIERQYVARTYEKRFSRTRTVAFGLAAAGGAVFVFGRALGVGFSGGGDPPPDTSVGSLRPRR